MSIRRKKRLLTDIQTWECVMNGEMSRFPPDFWTKESFRIIFRHICRNYSREDICNIRYIEFLKEKKIITGLKKFDLSVYNMLCYCMPELSIKPWELYCVPNGYWEDDTENKIRDAVLWAFKRRDISSREQILDVFSFEFLNENSLTTLKKYGLATILRISVPEYDIKEWELKRVYQWNDELVEKAIKEILNKEGLTKENVKTRLSLSMLRKHRLDSMLYNRFNNNMEKLLAYIDKLN